MNTLLIFVIRLILGLVFGILLIRVFRPEWGLFHGVITGLVLVALAYAMRYFKTSKAGKKG
jgi:multisubunit Na+/H+ antiporter MnhB subunit